MDYIYNHEKLKNIAYRMIKLGKSVDYIVEITQLPKNEVEEILHTHNSNDFASVVEQIKNVKTVVPKKTELTDILVVVKDIHTLLKEIHVVLKTVVDSI